MSDIFVYVVAWDSPVTQDKKCYSVRCRSNRDDYAADLNEMARAGYRLARSFTVRSGT